MEREAGVKRIAKLLFALAVVALLIGFFTSPAIAKEKINNGKEEAEKKGDKPVAWYCPEFATYFDEYVFYVKPNTSVSDDFILVFNESVENAKIEVSRKLQGIVSLNTTELGSVSAGENVSVRMTININDEQRKKINGFVFVSGNGKKKLKKKVKIKINVNENILLAGRKAIEKELKSYYFWVPGSNTSIGITTNSDIDISYNASTNYTEIKVEGRNETIYIDSGGRIALRSNGFGNVTGAGILKRGYVSSDELWSRGNDSGAVIFALGNDAIGTGQSGNLYGSGNITNASGAVILARLYDFSGNLSPTIASYSLNNKTRIALLTLEDHFGILFDGVDIADATIEILNFVVNQSINQSSWNFYAIPPNSGHDWTVYSCPPNQGHNWTVYRFSGTTITVLMAADYSNSQIEILN